MCITRLKFPSLWTFVFANHFYRQPMNNTFADLEFIVSLTLSNNFSLSTTLTVIVHILLDVMCFYLLVLFKFLALFFNICVFCRCIGSSIEDCIGLMDRYLVCLLPMFFLQSSMCEHWCMDACHCEWRMMFSVL